MMAGEPLNQLAWARLRPALAILADRDTELTAGDTWKLVLDQTPPSEYELEIDGPDLRRIRNHWQWASTTAVKAGWLEKPKGLRWRITEAGRAALVEYTDPNEMRFAANELYAQWQATRPDSGRRAWLIRPPSNPSDLPRRWRTEGFVSLAATHLSETALGADQTAIRQTVEDGYQHLEAAQRTVLANEYYAFLSRMSPDDLVSTVVDDALSVGVIIGEPEYDPAAPNAKLRRAAAWLDAEPIPIASLPGPLPAELGQPGTLIDLTGAVSVLAELAGPVREIAEREGPTRPAPRPAPVAVAPPTLASATAQLADDLNLTQDWLQELIDLVQARTQVILYGPPGTGKTFIAQAVAAHVADRDAVSLVQFHPSYSYEDFFEGFRPIEDDKGRAAGFGKVWGPLRNLASAARNNQERPYVLIIDEVNRANPAKVFGELYFLLEYRDMSVRLQYSPTEAFTLPPNLFVIGTMNTADRSIARLDAAIRRRFAFVELHPDDPPVRDVLKTWLAKRGRSDERARLLQGLNEAIGAEDHDVKIGPSYLMKPHVEVPGGLERVWRHDLLPLLEEHYYGRYSRTQIHARFSLDEVRRRVNGQAQPPADPDEA